MNIWVFRAVLNPRPDRCVPESRWDQEQGGGAGLSERSGEIKSGEVELDSQERSGEIKSREVELDSQERSGEIKSREVELDSHCELDNPLLHLFLNGCFSDIDRVTLQLLKEQLAKYTSSFTQWQTVSWVFESWSMRMNYSCLSPSPFLPHR